MYNFINGVVVESGSNYIVVENNEIGYEIYVANPLDFTVGEKQIVYIHQHVREDALTLFGMRNKEDKQLFKKLINVKGIGPRIALIIIATASVSGVIGAVDRGDVKFFQSIPGVGPKAAQQIMLDLKGKLEIEVSLPPEKNDAFEVLKSLGYKPNEVYKVLEKVTDEGLTANQYVKKALALLVK